MYFTSAVTVDLQGTQVQLKPPTSFFGGIANVVTGGSWAEKSDRETFTLMALVQSLNRVLRANGVDNVVRIAVGDKLIYEDSKHVEDDFQVAMGEMVRQVEGGLDLEGMDQFVFVLEHDDDVLRYVIEFDVCREHRHNVDPISVKITAVSSALRRGQAESGNDFYLRAGAYFASQEALDGFQGELARRFADFTGRVRDGLAKELGVEQIRVDRQTRVARTPDNWTPYTAYGQPFYGYDALWDLCYMDMWQALMSSYRVGLSEFVYTEPDGRALTEVSGSGWQGGDFERFETLPAGEQAAAGEGHVTTAPSGGGWLDSLGDALGGGGDGGDGGGCGGCGGCGGGD